MRGFRFHVEALREFEEVVEYYSARSPEAASGFVDAFEAAATFLLENPQVGTRLDCGARRWNLRRFPYALIFRAVDDIVEIVAVMHERREPEYWRNRLRHA